MSLNSAYAQSGTIYDNFSDSDFTQSPTWIGNTGDFEILADSGNNELHLKATSSGSTYLSLQSPVSYGSWEFFIRLDFAPSGSNKAIIFLTSDRSDGDAMASGYALVLGESGSGDVVRLARYDNGSRTNTILSGSTNIATGGRYQIKVTRDTDGTWKLFVGTGYGSVPQFEASGTDNTYSTSSYFVLNPHYTNTRSDKFYFDDIRIQALPIIPVSVQAISNSQLNILFSQDVDPSSLLISDFQVSDGIGQPSQASLKDNRTVSAFFSPALKGGNYKLTIGNIKSSGGNIMSADTSLSFSLFDRSSSNDIVINEFMYDPPDNVPEYVELYNRSGKTFDLKNWRLEDRTSTVRIISSDSFIVHPGSYLVITSDSSKMISAFGKHRYIEMPSFPTLNNSGDAIILKSSQGTIIDSLSYAGGIGTPGIALERRSPDVSSGYEVNWAPSPSSSGGTPGYINQLGSDDLHPKMNYLNVVDSQNIKLGFSEPLDSLSASTKDSYTFSPVAVPSSINLIGSDTIQISFNNSLQSDTLYTFYIRNITDLFGNKVSPSDTTFTYYHIEQADSGDVLITEFMPRPPDSYSEYIELYNRSSKTLDLDNWLISDNTGNKQKTTYTKELLTPHHYIVLCPDSTIQYLFPSIDTIVLGSRFPNLNNNGDAIALYDNQGLLLDSLYYDASWGTGTVSLERRDLNVKAIYRENWGLSPAPGGGTPGKQNLVKPDTTPPTLQSLSIVDAQHMQLRFSETPEKSSIIKTDHYILNPSSGIAKISQPDRETIRLKLQDSLKNNFSYTLTLSGISDLFGNPMPKTDTTFTFYQPTPADSGDVLITEFMYNPPDKFSEYVELYNRSKKSVNLQNWSYSDNANNPTTITGNYFIVPPNSYVVIAPDSSLINLFPKIRLIVMKSRFHTLNNSGDAIVIRSGSGILMDSLTYNPEWGNKELALERRSLNLAAIHSENWGLSPADRGGTPGMANAIRPDTIPPRLQNLVIIDTLHVNLHFSETLETSTIVNKSHYSIKPSIQLGGIKYDGGTTVSLTLNNSLKNDTTYTLTLSNIADLFGNAILKKGTTFTFYQPTQADSGDVLISEFMPRPPDGFTEYIELYNQSQKTVDMDSWSLSDNTGHRQTIVSQSLLLPPRQYIVLCPDSTLIKKFPDIHVAILSRQFPSLNNDGDAIVIFDNKGILLDSLSYDNSWGTGDVAFERRSLAVRATYPENWGPSLAKEGGTPGSPNLIKKDKTAPVFDKVNLVKPNLLRLYFSKRISANHLQNDNNFSLEPLDPIKSMKAQKKQIDLLLKQSLKGYTDYKITAKGVTDIFGNRSKSKSFEIIYKPDITPPVLISARYTMNLSNIRLHFTEPVKIDKNTKVYMDGLPVGDITLLPDDSTIINVQPGGLPNLQKDDYIKLADIADESGNRLSDTTAIIGRPPSRGQLVINEIMYNPIQDKRDGLQDQSEYIECYNRSSFTLYLKDIAIHTPPDEHNIISYLIPVPGRNMVVKPHRYFVIHADTATIFTDTRIARYFNPHTDSMSFLRINRSTLGFSSSGATIYLSNAQRNIDSLTYDNSWQNPNLPDARGISLERIDVNSSGDTPSNWGSSVTPKGGTPGSRNSIAAAAIDKLTNEGINISPNPFSPDNDGYDDHLLIRYRLKNPDYLLHIRIFDRFGRLICTLADGKQAGTNGTIIWDGLSKNHHPNRVGIYIILFEAYDPAGGAKKTYKKTVVLARKL